MQVLITGGAGFIGSHLVERLLRQGDRIRVLDNLSTGKIGNLPVAPALEFVRGDIRDPAIVERCMQGIDAVVHLAAVASVQASIDDPITTHQTNLDGTIQLLEATRRQGVPRFLYASSAAVYGDTQTVPVPESAATRPLSPYAADKLAGEHYLQFYQHKFGLNATGFRFFNIYGPRQDPSSPYSGVISIFTDRLAQSRGVTIFGDGQQTRDFVYVGDLAELLAEALMRTDMAGQLFNVGTGKETSLLALLGELEAVSGKRIARDFAPARIGDIVRSCADVSVLRKIMGKVPTTSMREGLKRLLAYNEASR